jgi:hypothetical protein
MLGPGEPERTVYMAELPLREMAGMRNGLRHQKSVR